MVPYDTAVTIDRESDEPRYQQLAAILRAQFESNEIAPGKPLPSEAALGRKYGVTRGTARAAIQVLRDEGLVETYPVRGTFRRNDA